ncbi:MAG: hypothetical protein MRJ92_13495 [Nitrospira sp.]|nr:hypothetical protein [Nitrospira sp.]
MRPTSTIFLIQKLFSARWSVTLGVGESFPYWLLGWNYVGMRHGDETHHAY